jgi:hypothetical protein
MKDDTTTTVKLLGYMKRYSELLYSWGMTKEAIEMSKIIGKVDLLLRNKI